MELKLVPSPLKGTAGGDLRLQFGWLQRQLTCAAEAIRERKGRGGVGFTAINQREDFAGIFSASLRDKCLSATVGHSGGQDPSDILWRDSATLA